MREKLIELLTNSEILCNDCGQHGNSYCIEAIADHLIANGVTVQGEIDANIYQLMRKCERLKEQNESLANAVNVLEEINSDLYKKLKGVTVQKWIPVTERLPEPFEIVYVYIPKDKRITDAYITRHMEWVGVRMNREVTHWMPLPESPKGE